MASGFINHPAFLTRQVLTVTNISTAGANTVQGATSGIAFPYDVRLRNAVATVQTAGTSAGSGAQVIIYCPGTSVQFPDQPVAYASLTSPGGDILAVTTNTTTTTLGSIALGTSVAGSVAIAGDLNVRIPAGEKILVKNGTDATSKYSLTIEFHLDPVTSTWTPDH